jgi:hypothetical protein
MPTKRPQNTILTARLAKPVALPDAPQLLVVVDTEEEFDWNKPFDRTQTAVSHISDLWRIQSIFEKHHFIPTYVVDYPVAANPTSAAYLKDLALSGRALIGAHLQPWVSPPHEEDVNEYNSYPSHLPVDLEQRKLAMLSDAIVTHIGVKPRIYKAGRYGINVDSLTMLSSLGFDIDCSTMPGFDLRPYAGPNFVDYPASPYWLSAGRHSPDILELPTTGGHVGALAHFARQLKPLMLSKAANTFKMKALLAKFGLCERIRLSPEGFGLDELRRLTRALHARGVRVFSMSLHSPSVGVGHTRYARTEAERDMLLQTLDAYMRWFLGEFGGESSTPYAIFDRA